MTHCTFTFCLCDLFWKS